MPAMTEEPKPTPRPRRRLFVSNPDSDADDDEKQSGELHRPYCPPPLPSPSTRSQYAQRPMPPHYAPPPLTTNLPPDTQHHSSSSRSNPTLSSPSTTDSPIIDIDSTPPPSTPGVSAPPIDLSGGDGPSRNEKPPAQPFNEPCTPSRAMNILDKVKSHLPRSHYSKSHSRPHTVSTLFSPTMYRVTDTFSVAHRVCYRIQFLDIDSISNIRLVQVDSVPTPPHHCHH